MTDGYAMFQFKGDDALHLLKQGAFVNVDASSRSVATGLFGIPRARFMQFLGF